MKILFLFILSIFMSFHVRAHESILLKHRPVKGHNSIRIITSYNKKDFTGYDTVAQETFMPGDTQLDVIHVFLTAFDVAKAKKNHRDAICTMLSHYTHEPINKAQYRKMNCKPIDQTLDDSDSDEETPENFPYSEQPESFPATLNYLFPIAEEE